MTTLQMGKHVDLTSPQTETLWRYLGPGVEKKYEFKIEIIKPYITPKTNN